ncbi:MAG: DEAD/DEAH box helicase [Helicobacter sp.]|nr:DEAD/DEAH box helicase [Helicobacter sp.]
MDLSNPIKRAISDAGFKAPSAIQKEAIPVILKGRDIIAQAQTGTGKTAAFALPILEKIKKNEGIQALVVTPTRELAMQINDEVFKLGKYINAKTICIYGGQSIKKQCDLLQKNPHFMIATPGRLLDHLKNDRLKNFAPKYIVLDESDEMLDMGFLDDIEEIFNYLSDDIQVMLFSATMPKAIANLASKILNNPVSIKITPTTNMTNADIEQRYYMINDRERSDAIMRLLDTELVSKAIVFTRTKKEASDLNILLESRDYNSRTLHGDMDQRDRRSAILDFKSGNCDVLVATDVASRGLDISDVSHVFNYHMPLNSEVYVHRIGRTGRAGRKGIAITLVTPLEYKDLKKIQSDVGSKLELYEIPQTQISSKKIIQEILQTRVEDCVIEIYEELKNNLDSSQIILKLLSMQVDAKEIGIKNFKEIEKPARSDLKHKGNRGSRNQRGRGPLNARNSRDRNDRESRNNRDRRNDRGGEKKSTRGRSSRSR